MNFIKMKTPTYRVTLANNEEYVKGIDWCNDHYGQLGERWRRRASFYVDGCPSTYYYWFQDLNDAIKFWHIIHLRTKVTKDSRTLFFLNSVCDREGNWYTY